MEELIKFIIEKLTDHPENITVSREGDDIKIVVPKAEMGKLIGRQGRIAKSIRTIVKAANRGEEKINVEITEAE